MIDWKKYFDQVFVLHYAGYSQVEDRLCAELTRVGLSNSGILTIHNNISSPLLKTLSKNIDKDPNDMRESSFSCSFGHYSIMKIAELKNYNRILILEDDIVFHKDIDTISYVFDSVLTENPDYDMCLFSHFQSPCCENSNDVPLYIKEMHDANQHNRMMIPFNSHSAAVASGVSYGLSRRGYICIRGLYEHQFQIADMIFRNIPYHLNGHIDNFHYEILEMLKRYYCRIQISLQKNERRSVTGDILNANFDKIMNAQQRIAELAGIKYSDYNF